MTLLSLRMSLRRALRDGAANEDVQYLLSCMPLPRAAPRCRAALAVMSVSLQYLPWHSHYRAAILTDRNPLWGQRYVRPSQAQSGRGVCSCSSSCRCKHQQQCCHDSGRRAREIKKNTFLPSVFSSIFVNQSLNKFLLRLPIIVFDEGESSHQIRVYTKKLKIRFQTQILG